MNSSTGESPALEAIAAEGYATEHNVSVEVARQALDRQGRAAGLGEEIAAGAAGSGYAGVWFSHVDRRVKVGLTNGTTAVPVQQSLEARGLSTSADIVRVSDTERELEQERDRLRALLADLMDARLLVMSFRPASNAVVLQTASAMSAADRTRVNNAAAGASVTVTVVARSVPAFRPGLLYCSIKQCDPPMRGGVSMWTDLPAGGFGPFCTSGFIVKRKASVDPSQTPHVLTAGHCLRNNIGTGPWAVPAGARRSTLLTLGSENPNHQFGQNGDFGLIGITATSVYRPEQQLRPWVIVTRVPRSLGNVQADYRYRLTGSSTNQEEVTVCMTGHVSGTKCGEVKDLGYYNDDDGVGSLAVMVPFGCRQNEPVTQMKPGDSGAPVIRGRHAKGILSGYEDADARCRTTFSGATIAEAQLGVDILP